MATAQASLPVTGVRKELRGDTAYTVTGQEAIVAIVSLTAGGLAITLPSAATKGPRSPILIKDESGAATASNPITITPAAGTIDGMAMYTIATAYGSLTLYPNGESNWSISAPNAAGDTTLTYGDGSDGSFNADGTAVPGPWAQRSVGGGSYILLRDAYVQDLTIGGGVLFNTHGYRLFVAGIFTNIGTLQNLGEDAIGSTGGPGGVQGSISGGTAGGSGTAGGNGGNGGNATAAGTGAIGGNGGSGTGVSGVTAGGVGGTESALTLITGGDLHASPFAQIVAVIAVTSSNCAGGTGGGAGGGSTGGVAGGGGGGGGGVVFLAAKALNNAAGSILATGGKGAAGVSGNAGGGGGGGGGAVVITSRNAQLGTVSANGGTGGAGSGTGNAGAAAPAGTLYLMTDY